MSKEVVAEVIALIELGMIAPEDIVKCLRKANAEPEKALTGNVKETQKIEHEPAQQALDKKAENARELGLDYEPSAGTQVSKVWWEGEKLMAKPIPLDAFYAPAQQKSVAVMQLCASGWDLVEDVDLDWLHTLPFGTILYTSPPQRTWVGLTDSEIQRLGDLDVDSNYFGLWYDFAKSIEAKLKEKNT